MGRRDPQQAPAAAVAVLLLASCLLALPPAVAAARPPPAADAPYSSLWGEKGELWDPSTGRLPDFSYAGYRQGNAKLPTPPVTVSVLDARFTTGATNDTQVFQRALNWANAQPVVPGEYLVLEVPAGTFTIEERLVIRRPWLVLRGAGSQDTTLYFPYNLQEVEGPNPDDNKGAYVNTEGFLTVKGNKRMGEEIASVAGEHKRGATTLQLNQTTSLQAGDYIATWWVDKDGKFDNHMFEDLWEAPAKYADTGRVQFTAEVLAVEDGGSRLTLERGLPYDIRSDMVEVKVHTRADGVREVGVEGIAFEFKWSLYAGHHLEKGYNALFFDKVRDCWARDIRTIHADSSILFYQSEASTIRELSVEARQPRANDIPNAYGERADADGHWGVGAQHTFDLLVDGFETTCQVLHDVGTGSGSKWLVFMNGKMKDGNLDLHRALTGPSLYTNIDVGLGTNALYSGGPPASGPNAAFGTTWWNIQGRHALDPNYNGAVGPGSCAFGPAINLVNVDLTDQALCKTWLYERSVKAPANLYEAQKKLRKRAARRAAKDGGPGSR